ncbi:MoaD/ThiS family protein (plasmid) [Rhizobium sp. CB3060]|uniref:sulfur carrier protein ThiS n=1 Tax=Rhizobium sp. CB3060 TaxID=3138255 RepID=UPI0021A37AEE|nr:sulfur carrier protein ThiS [Rhizobium tropici]UWU25753.1 MoaD/ThiS family protein [Rhizobium tropici]
MHLIINGEAQTIARTTLSQLLAALDYEGDWLATAVNDEHILADNNKIEILTPKQGG